MDCIMIALKPQMRGGTSDPRIKIPKTQIAIIKALVDAYMFAKGNNASSA